MDGLVIVTGERVARIEVFLARHGWSWRWMDANGRELSRSENDWPTTADAERDAREYRDAAAAAPIFMEPEPA